MLGVGLGFAYTKIAVNDVTSARLAFIKASGKGGTLGTAPNRPALCPLRNNSDEN